MESVSFPGRVLFLSEDPGKIRRQLGGEDLALAEALPSPGPDQHRRDHARLGLLLLRLPPGGLPLPGPASAATPSPSRSTGCAGAASASACPGSAAARAPAARPAPTRSSVRGLRLVIAESFERDLPPELPEPGPASPPRTSASSTGSGGARPSPWRSSPGTWIPSPPRSCGGAASSPSTRRAWRGSSRCPLPAHGPAPHDLGGEDPGPQRRGGRRCGPPGAGRP